MTKKVTLYRIQGAAAVWLMEDDAQINVRYDRAGIWKEPTPRVWLSRALVAGQGTVACSL